MKKISAMTLPLILAVTLMACSSDKKTQQTGSSSTRPDPASASAPALALKDNQGEDTRLADFAGKVIILDFWATWCPPCREEIPHFIELQNEYGEKGLQVIGVSVDQKGWNVVVPFMKENGINYPILMTDEKAYNDYQELLPPEERGGIPFTFVIDRKGVVRRKYVGYRDKAVFEEAIKSLL